MRIRYEGPAPFASLVAQRLEEQGVPVTYRPKIEARSAQEVVEAVVIYMGVKIADGLTGNLIDAAIERVKAELGERIKAIRLSRED